MFILFADVLCETGIHRQAVRRHGGRHRLGCQRCSWRVAFRRRCGKITYKNYVTQIRSFDSSVGIVVNAIATERSKNCDSISGIGSDFFFSLGRE